MRARLRELTKTTPPIDEYEEGCEFNWEDDCEDTGLLDEKYTEEEASLRHKGESLSSDLSDFNDKNDDDDKTCAKDNTFYGDGGGSGARGGGGDSTRSGGGSAEWMQFPSPTALSETLGAMA